MFLNSLYRSKKEEKKIRNRYKVSLKKEANGKQGNKKSTFIYKYMHNIYISIYLYIESNSIGYKRRTQLAQVMY